MHLVLATALLALCVGGCSSTSPPPRVAPPPTRPPPVVVPDTPVITRGEHPLDDAARFLTELRPYVEAECNQRFTQPPRVTELDLDGAAAAFRRDLAADFAARYPGLTDSQRAALMERAASTAARSSVARYSVTSKAILVVRSAFDEQRARMGVTPEEGRNWLRATLAHELVHALDDERFDLGPRYAAAAADPERARAFAMLIEGRAVWFGRRAADEAGLPERLSRILPGGSTPTGVPALTLHLTYSLGAAFVGSVVERDGVRLADRAVRRAPAETFLICHPDAWPDPGADKRPGALLKSARFDERVTPLSELQLRVRYAGSEGIDGAARLFAGFRGGRQVIANDTNHAVLAFTSEADAERYAAISRTEASVKRHGTLVLRAAGRDPDGGLERLVRALSQ